MTNNNNPLARLADLHRQIAALYGEMAGESAPQPARPARQVKPAKPAALAQDACPDHGPDSVRPSKYGGLYCTARDEDGFCKWTSKQEAA